MKEYLNWIVYCINEALNDVTDWFEDVCRFVAAWGEN